MAYVEAKLIGWAPDADPTTPGVLTDVDGVVPSLRGYKAEKEFVTWGVSAIPSTAIAVWTDRRSFSVERPIVGTKGKIYKVAQYTNEWEDITGSTATSVGMLYSNKWQPDSFGKVNLVVNNYNPLRHQTTAMTAFTVVTGAPSADAIAVSSNFVMLGNTLQIGSFQYDDAWWCSALGDYTDWTPSVATQCARGRLTDTPGAIYSMTAFGRDVVAMKRAGMWVGRYVGPPVIWDWSLLHRDIGSYFQNSVVVANDVMYWWGEQGAFMFDGSRARPIPNAPVNFVRGLPLRSGGDLGLSQFMPYTLGTYSVKEDLIRWYLLNNFGLQYTMCLSLHIKTMAWGKDEHVEITAAGRYQSYLDGDRPLLVKSWTHWPVQYGVNSLSPSKATTVTTGDVGQIDRVSTLRTVRPRWTATPPSVVTATHLYRDDLGVTASTGAVATMTAGKFDFSQQSRWHRLTIAASLVASGDTELCGIAYDLEPGGER